MKTFEIPVIRIGYGSRIIKVKAENLKEAEAKALDEAGDHEYIEHSSEYQVEDSDKTYNITVTPHYIMDVDSSPVDIEIGRGDDTLLKLEFDREDYDNRKQEYYANDSWSVDGMKLEQLQGILKLFGHNYLLADLELLLNK